jgi:hypothetical protein
MASPAGTAKLAPKSGFASWQFWLGLAAVLGTFILGALGVKLDLTQLSKLPDFVKSGIVGVSVVGVIGAFIAISSWLETRTIRRNDTVPSGKGAPARNKVFYQTSEFWLGLISVVLSYLEQAKALPFAANVQDATSLTTLVIALVYTFARSQLKQAYAQAQQDHS